ncbi:type II secretion system protein [Hoeflea sp. TYP-13]|uniref:type II secretion system protein n=1 Tax=Hoeflea sp. TYP-13 TaxID=3230023 RepID=UPI0034C6B67D
MKTGRHSDDREAGFTLLETIVAFAVISISLAIAVRGISVSLHNAERSRVQEEMRQLARAVLAENSANSETLTKDDSSPDGRFDWKLSIRPITIEAASNVRVITLEITHKAPPALTTEYVTFERGE